MSAAENEWIWPVVIGGVVLVLGAAVFESVANLVGTACIGRWSKGFDGLVITGDILTMLGVVMGGGVYCLRQRVAATVRGNPRWE